MIASCWLVQCALAQGIVCGNARFTAMTDRLIRMEWSADGVFEDRPTLTFVTRSEIPVKVDRQGDGLVIDTGRVKIRYAGGGRFSSSNLSADLEVAGVRKTWRFGDADDGNLMGTRRTLDLVNGWETLRKNARGELERGLVSRDGWTVVDDSSRHVLADAAAPWNRWAAVRPAGERQDLYLFAYGHDYRAALGDYVRFAGRIPLPPKWAFGYWWSRYWEYSDEELRDLVKTIKSLSIPIDVLIVDMDWHKTWTLDTDRDHKDEFGQRVGWTGYTWEPRLFPNPDAFFSWCRSQHLKTSLNLHPASGIQPYEDCFANFAADYGWTGTNAVPFAIDEPKWCDSYFRTVLDPMTRSGVDFWWLDWQQWLEAKGTPGLSNTFWLNHVFYSHAERLGAETGARPMIYHRWGGLGSHRYQVGFSGDIGINWESLEILPYFTATAANVGYGYWGHDIGGHWDYCEMGKDAELFTRWLQVGAFMPLFKTHPGKREGIERRIWKYADRFETMREAFRLRYRLAPYLYTAARKAYDTGVSVCHPLYYDWPESDEAYDRRFSTHMFGDDILAVAVAKPADGDTGLSDVEAWLPPGRWYEAASGRVVEGGRIFKGEFTLEENPRFAKSGSVLPLYSANVDNLQTAPQDEMAFMFVPGADGGRGTLYEDDGLTLGYRNDFATTDAVWQDAPDRVRVEILPRKGSYAGMSAVRRYTLRFPRRLPPSLVTVGGRTIPYSREGGVGTWTYDGQGLEVIVECPEVSCAKGLTAELRFGQTDHAALDGLKGAFGRSRVMIGEFKVMLNRHIARRCTLPDAYRAFTQVSNIISERPADILAILANREAARPGVEAILEKFSAKMPEGFIRRVREQLLR